MEHYAEEMWGGPGHLRFYLQPILAMLLGIRDGVRDAKGRHPPYLLMFLEERGGRKAQLKALLKRLTTPLVIAIAMDLLFQQVIRHSVRPGASVLYAAIFVALPYAVARSLANRVARPLVRRAATA